MWRIILFLFISVSLFGDWEGYKKEVLRNQKKFHGWCSEEKAIKMMDLIYATHPVVCVEIGVFGGSSIYPTAAALKACGEGTVYAIDPWSNEECLKGYEVTDPNYKWWSSIDLEKIYREFLKKLHQYDVLSNCTVMRQTSEQALSSFDDESIDILHIDGNHTEEIALHDIEMYFPKVKQGGYIWFDDVNWATTARAISYLMEVCDDFDHERSTSTCLLFRKP